MPFACNLAMCDSAAVDRYLAGLLLPAGFVSTRPGEALTDAEAAAEAENEDETAAAEADGAPMAKAGTDEVVAEREELFSASAVTRGELSERARARDESAPVAFFALPPAALRADPGPEGEQDAAFPARPARALGDAPCACLPTDSFSSDEIRSMALDSAQRFCSRSPTARAR
jgi:hypothetical protein